MVGRILRWPLYQLGINQKSRTSRISICMSVSVSESIYLYLYHLSMYMYLFIHLLQGTGFCFYGDQLSKSKICRVVIRKDKLWASWNPRAQAKAVAHRGAFFSLSICLCMSICLLPVTSHPLSAVSKSFQMNKSNSPRLSRITALLKVS